MFKIKKEQLLFALNLGSKALAQRQQEELLYRSIRITTFDNDGEKYVAFGTNGGYNAVKTTGFKLLEFRSDIDVLVECQKLLDVVSKASVEEIIFEKVDDENLMVFANGENKIRYLPGAMIAEFPEYNDKEKLGTMTVKDFSHLCKLTTPFTTDDIHKAPLIGLCIDRGNIYATDEFKAITIERVGLQISKQLNFNPIISEMVKMFAETSTIDFYLGKNEGAESYTHLAFIIEGMELFILKYQTQYASEILDTVNEKCRTGNLSQAIIAKASTLEALARISIFADENDILILKPIATGLILEVINTKTGEESTELVEAKMEVDEELMNQKFHISLANFKILLETLELEEIPLKFSANQAFISVQDSNYIAWLTKKRNE